MCNCFKVFELGRLVCIFPTRAGAEWAVELLVADIGLLPKDAYRIEPAFVENAGF